MIINGQRVKTTHARNPSDIPWKALGVEYLCESTGVFLTAESAAPHVAAGVKKVIFSAPAKDKSPTIVMGVNEDSYLPEYTYVSCASCTTNGIIVLASNTPLTVFFNYGRTRSHGTSN